MGQVTLTINGKNYGMSCDDGQEQRVLELGHYVDGRLKEIAKMGAASGEAHLLVLTSLMLADEIFELRDQAGEVDPNAIAQSEANQAEVAAAIDELAEQIDTIAQRIQKA